MNNRDLLQRSLKAVWHPCTQMKQHANNDASSLPLIPVSRGQGAWLYDFDDKPYLDAISSWWVNLFGHANPRINAALRDQMEKCAWPLFLRLGRRFVQRNRPQNAIP